MSDGLLTLLKILVIILGATFGFTLLVMLIGVVFKMTFRITGNIFRFIGETTSDILRLIGAVLAAVIFSPMVLLSIVIGRWSASKHYAGAFADECKAGGRCVYRLFAGNPARLLGLSGALEGVERRIPDAMAAAPGRDKPARRVGQFDGYSIVGSLKGGGSGGKLYIAEPDEMKRAVFSKRNLKHVDQVVIKSFSLQDGSSLPQIVRESRALDAARKLGLVIEHEMTPERFYYVMRYVPGESLAVVTKNFHAMSSADGLDAENLRSVLGYARDLLVALNAYHGSGLWHKDVKPDNIIVDGRDAGARAHLVDFGLVTPLRSAMTLTTHGTEYFRDPELVRQALRGVKVHQIDGSKFDVYGAGAVLFSMIENSFPAHGGLSQITKKCPDALRWIVRRSMAEYDRRYPSASAMLADVEVLLNAEHPFAVKPVDLPSVSGGDVQQQIAEDHDRDPGYNFGADSAAPKFDHRAASPVPPRNPSPAGDRVGRPKTRVHGWWTGKYHVVDPSHRAKSPDQLEVPLYAARARVLRAVDDRKPAKHQVKAARKRAQQMRNRAQARVKGRSGAVERSYSNTPGAVVVVAGSFALVLALGLAFAFTAGSNLFDDGPSSTVVLSPMPPAVAPSVGQHDDVVNEELPMVDASILVVSDLHLPLPEQAVAEFSAGFEQLRRSGLDLGGDLIDGANEETINTIAELRHHIGALPLDAPRFSMRIREWFDGSEYDGVLWFAYNPEDPASTYAVLVTDQLYWSQTPVEEDLPGRVVRVLASNGYQVADE